MKHGFAINLLSPIPILTERDTSRGMTWFVWEGASTMGFGSIMSSGFITAYVLLLGANNLQIGILAVLPFIAQPLQLLQTPNVERVRRRKLLAVIAWATAQAIWLPIALIPVFLSVPGALSVSALLALVGVRAILGTVMIVNRDS